ncbi:unnamed protein product, partial [marine sediment metagenome]
MAIEKVYLDPNAAAYTDDEIVGKVNTATDKITRADSVEVAAILESATEKLMSDTEKTKLEGIAEGAEINPADLAELDPTANTKLTGIEEGAKVDQTGAEIRDAVVGLADDDRQIIISRPTTGQKKIYAVQTHTDG